MAIHRKFLSDLNARLVERPGTVSCSLLTKAIRAEIQSKNIPRFVKNEICDHMTTIESFVKENPATKETFKSDLTEFFKVVKDFQPNHEGVIRAAYSKFRKQYEELVQSAHSLMELLPEYQEKLKKMRRQHPLKTRTVANRIRDTPEELANIIEEWTDLHLGPVQSYRSSGVKVCGNIHKNLNVPNSFKNGSAMKSQINSAYSLVENVGHLKTKQRINFVLISLNRLIEAGAIQLLEDYNVSTYLGNMVTSLKERNESKAGESAKAILSITNPHLHACAEWLEIDGRNERSLERIAAALYASPDDLMLRMKYHFHKQHEVCY